MSPACRTRSRTIRVPENGQTALATVQYDESALTLGKSAYEVLQETVSPAEKAGLQVEFGGEAAAVQ